MTLVLASGSILTAGAAAHGHYLWVTTRKNAVIVLKQRFANIRTVRCSPDRTSRTRVFAQTRYWQRFWCSGQTRDDRAFRLRFVARGQCVACWTITDLSGVGVAHLHTRTP